MRLDFFRAIVILRKKTYNQTVGYYLGFVWLILDTGIDMVYLFVFSVIAHREEPAVIYKQFGHYQRTSKITSNFFFTFISQITGGFPIERVRTRVTVDRR